MIPFNNLKPLHRSIEGEINEAVQRVLASGWYILGPEVEQLEAEFAAWHGKMHAVSVANGTDAIELALRAAGIGAGDEVITVAHTAVATVCAIERAGATPVIVDIDPVRYTLDPNAASAAITPRTKAIVPVHIYGHPADMDGIKELAERHQLFLLEDCAQAHGARYGDQLVGTFGHAAAFSCYPTKNLGAYGDGGLMLTPDAALAERMKRIRNYGQTVRYHHAERGVNSRLDEMQAAILRVKLAHLDEHNGERRRIAEIYARQVRGVALPESVGDVRHVYHLFVVRHPDRDRLREDLKTHGVDSQIHYPIPVHLQPAYADLGYVRGSLPVTERVADEILSLPMYVGLSDRDVEIIGTAVTALASKEGNAWKLPISTNTAARAA